MSHSLNEIRVAINSGTASGNFDLIVQAIVDNTGWKAIDTTFTSRTKEKTIACNTIDDVVTTNTIGITISQSGNYIYMRGMHGPNSYMYEYSYSSAQNNTYLCIHRSKNEKTTYLRWSGNNGCSFLYALNENDEPTLFEFYDYQNNYGGSTGLYYTNLQIGYSTRVLPGLEAGLNFSITKMPDPRNYSSFPEVYYVISGNNYSMENTLVNFNGEVYRICFFHTSGMNYGALAFPVSDPT